MVFMNIKFFFNSGDSVFECPICYKNLAENKNPDNIKFIQEQHDSFNQIFYFFDSECLNKIKKTNPITNNNIQNIISFSELNQRQISCFKDNAEAANKEIYIQKSSELNESQFNTDLFFKWSGKITKHMPWTVLQLNINNIFNNRSLISTGLNNARYQEGRNIVFSAGMYF